MMHYLGRKLSPHVAEYNVPKPSKVSPWFGTPGQSLLYLSKTILGTGSRCQRPNGAHTILRQYLPLGKYPDGQPPSALAESIGSKDAKRSAGERNAKMRISRVIWVLDSSTSNIVAAKIYCYNRIPVGHLYINRHGGHLEALVSRYG